MLPDTLCVGSQFGSTEEQQDCGACYHINMTVVMAIVIFDILLTIFITVAVICFVKSHNRRGHFNEGAERSVPSPGSKKMSIEAAESPYQELQGVQSDVYSELHHFRK